MNVAADAPSEPAALVPVRPFYWSVRRELWEHRSLYVAPLCVAALVLVAALIGALRLAARPQAAPLDAVQAHQVAERPYDQAALVLMFTTFLVGVFYCLDALQGERRDRSILFWKSLPVSDLTAVLAKASIPVVVIPAITFAITVLTQALMLLLGSAGRLGSGAELAALWSHVSLSRMSVLLLYHLVVVHGLWYAPIWGWLLLSSAWSRRAAYLWAALPLAVALVEKIAFDTTYLGRWLASRFMGGPDHMRLGNEPMKMDTLTPPPMEFLTSPGFWFGLLLAAIFLTAAVRLRRHRGPI